MQIPKAQKTVNPSVLFALLGSVRLKASSKMLVKSTPAGYHVSRLSACKGAAIFKGKGERE